MQFALTSLPRSLQLLFTFIRYCLSALTTSALDFIVFVLAQYYGASLGLAFFLSRLVAVSVNFPFNRQWVFHSNRSVWIVLAEYLVLVIVSGYCAYYLTQWLHETLLINVTFCKAIAETLLFFVNFLVQRFIIFCLPVVAGKKKPGIKPG